MIDTHILRDIAVRAGEIILEIYNQTDYKTIIKEDSSPLTLADKLANDFICKELKKHFPLIPIISEENKLIDFEIRKKWKSYFIVDPLDGTKEFIKRNGEFTVNIAYGEGQSIVHGIVYSPVLDILFYTEGSKAFKKTGNLVRELPLEVDDKKFSIVVSRSHLSKETRDYIEEKRKEFPNLVLEKIGSSLKICLVAEGSADIYPRLGPTMEWDTAAANAIVKNSGAKMFEYDSESPLLYNKENLLNSYFIVSR